MGKSVIIQKPMLFSAPMIRALLADQKHMTRRIYKPDAMLSDEQVLAAGAASAPHQVGSLIWCRETWAPHPNEPKDSIVYRATDPSWDEASTKDCKTIIWKPSIFLPRWASRISLRVTSVRCERLQQITEPDAVAEGMPVDDPVHDFMVLWNSINGAGAWERNPFVWAYTFERIEEKETSQTLKEREQKQTQKQMQSISGEINFNQS